MRIKFYSDLKPNLPIMKMAGYFLDRGDEIGLKIRKPNLLLCSWAFEKNSYNGKDETNCKVIEGGFFKDPKLELPHHIEHQMPYYKLYESNGQLIPRMGYTSRGCIRKCPWCIVWRKEGYLRDNAPISEFWDGKTDKIILLDNIFNKSPNFKQNINFLVENKIKVNIHQGMDVRGMTERMAEQLKSLKSMDDDFSYKAYFFAWDNIKDETEILKGVEIVRSVLGKSNLNFYILGGYPHGNNFDDTFYRCSILADWGVRPYVMPFKTSNNKIKDLKRYCNSFLWKKYGFEEGWRRYNYNSRNKTIYPDQMILA